MFRKLPVILLPLALAACDDATLASLNIPGITPPEPEVPVYPPEVIAALPPGAPPSVVIQNGDGCYLMSIEVTDPPSGFPLVDDNGNPVCEDDPDETAAVFAPAAAS